MFLHKFADRTAGVFAAAARIKANGLYRVAGVIRGGKEKGLKGCFHVEFRQAKMSIPHCYGVAQPDMDAIDLRRLGIRCELQGGGAPPQGHLFVWLRPSDLVAIVFGPIRQRYPCGLRRVRLRGVATPVGSRSNK